MIYGTPEFEELLRDVIKGKRHDCYDETVEHAEEMSWHFYGTKPDRLLSSSRPNEDQVVTDYRLENYEPITKSAADKSLNVVAKMFNPNLYSIRWKEDSRNKNSEELKSYTLEYYPGYNSIVNFTKDVLLRRMLADPNGVAVVTPYEIPEKQADRIYPVLKLYGSKAIFYYDKDHFLINTKHEEDENEFYFDYYDKDKTISFSVYLKNDDTIIEIEKEYTYNFGELPVWWLRGIPESLDNGDVIFKSFFSSAAPYWNLAIIHESDVFASYIRHMFPQKYELSEPCNYKYLYEGIPYPCKSGQILFGAKGGSTQSMTCPHCEGSGFKPIGPYGVYKYTKEKLQDSAPIGVDPVGYITVPTDATKMLEERAQRMIKQGMWSINMDVEDEVGEVQSGVAKVIDRSAQYDTLYNLGSVVYDVHLTNFYYFANKLMFDVESNSIGLAPKTVDKNLPEINKPTQFDIGSVTELVNNFKVAKDSGLDPDYLQMKQIEIQSRDMTTNPDLKAFTTILLELDPLPGMSQADMDRNVTRGYVKKTDAIIHINKKQFVERALRENKDFLKKTREEQLLILEGYAKELEKAAKPVLDTSMLNVA